jgi:sugar phosphate isomerase/epimerase
MSLPPFSAPIGKPGVQLYTVRDQMQNDVQSTLAKVAEIGYQEVEFAGYFGHDPAEIRGWLDEFGMSAPAAHIGFDAMQNDAASVIAAGKTVDHEFIVVPSMPDKLRGSIDGYKTFVKELNRLGKICTDSGMRLAYHNHDFEFEVIDGTVPFDIILVESDPDLIDLEIDLFWTIKGGHKPTEYFDEYPGRFKLCHVKDMASDGSMVDVGAGEIDFKAIFAEADKAGLEHFIVEHDEPEDSFASIAASYESLKELLQ